MKRPLPAALKNTALILAGLLLSTAAYRMYLIPNGIAAGGFTGIGQLVNQLTGLRVGTVSLILNVPLFAISFKQLGIRFGVRSALAMIGLSLLLDYLPVPSVTNDMLLAAVFGGLFAGLGFGMILRGNATTGGSDMLASLIHRHVPVLRVSVCIFMVDALVIVASAFVFDQQSAMYALICIFIMNVMIDMVLEGPNSAHSYFIISEHNDAIAKRLLEELDRGVTALDAKGMYSGEEKSVLLCVINRFETAQLRRIVFTTDPKAFVIANKVHEVFGEGFKDRP